MFDEMPQWNFCVFVLKTRLLGPKKILTMVAMGWGRKLLWPSLRGGYYYTLIDFAREKLSHACLLQNGVKITSVITNTSPQFT